MSKPSNNPSPSPRGDEFHESPPTLTTLSSTLPEAPITETEGAVIGRYKLLQVIGEGGFGVVYMAEQTEPVVRRVALKVIKLGMDTRQVIARFEAERQALAMMDHPNIAKVLDAGATDAGRPYFVMELVKGIPITNYCDQHKLSTEDRLRLFLEVCHAIQHAHQKGIIHRDLKPSNLLVTLHDGKPVPKVIDFGIAKATQTKLTDKTLFTRYEQIVGTPAYMSPEQAEMSGLDIDTRTDIYSLGVLLYELLTGATPFATRQLLSVGLDEMRRIIRVQEPVRPSTRLSCPLVEDDVSPRDAKSSAQLIKRLRRDLDWVVLKCLEKDRSRRYETANGLAEDVWRHLQNEPVAARAPTAVYRLQKLVRRHRTAAFAGSIVSIALLAAVVFSTLSFLRERKARLTADVAESARRRATSRADAETVRADQLLAFLDSLYGKVIPELQIRGHQDAIRQLLRVSDALADGLSNAPITRARLDLRIGEAYLASLNDFLAAAPRFDSASRLAARSGPHAVPLLNAASSARLAIDLWTGTDISADRKLRELAAKLLARNPPDIKAAASSLAWVALWYATNGRMDEAEAAARECLNIADHADARASRVYAYYVMGRVFALRSSFRESADQFPRAIDTFRKMPHNESLGELEAILSSFCWTAARAGQIAEAHRMIEDTLDEGVPENPALRLNLQSRSSELAARSGRWAEAFERFYAISTNSLSLPSDWKSAVLLASMLDRVDDVRSLILDGVARFAAGADDNNSILLSDVLLLPQSTYATHPLTRRLTLQALNGSRPWVRIWAGANLAALEYRCGRYPEAAQAIQKFEENIKTLGQEYPGPHFIRSMIELKLGHHKSARDAYTRGAKLLSQIFRGHGVPITHEFWQDECFGELLRREAASLLALTPEERWP